MRRTSLIFGFTALAPLAILAATVTAGQLRQQSTDAVERALTAAHAVNARIDGELLADDSALQVLAGSTLIERKDWTGARLRSEKVMRDRAGWRDVRLFDHATGLPIFSVRQGLGSPSDNAQGSAPDRPGIGNVSGQGDRKSTRLNSSHPRLSRMPSSA